MSAFSNRYFIAPWLESWQHDGNDVEIPVAERGPLPQLKNMGQPFVATFAMLKQPFVQYYLCAGTYTPAKKLVETYVNPDLAIALLSGGLPPITNQLK